MSDNTTQETSRRWKMSRRQFLLGLASGVGALAVGAYLGREPIIREVRLVANQQFISGGPPSEAPPTDPTIWFEIDADNTAHLYMPKLEMGQGVMTALAQIAADELDVEWETVVVHQPDTERGFAPSTIFTFGSTSVTSMYQPIREVSATMRYMIREEGASQFGVPVEDVTAELGHCFVTADPDQRLSYGEIIANQSGEWVMPEGDVTLKSADEFRYIGQSVQRVDFYEKVTGRARYGFDAQVEGMLYGAVARPPRYGAVLARASAGDAESQAGVVAVVIQDGFAGVVAETRPQAYAALDALDLTWDGGSTWNQEDLDEFIRIKDNDEAVLIQREGNVADALQNEQVITAEYSTPMAAHAHLEPQGSLAIVDGDQVTVYASTQAPDTTQNGVASALGIEPENVMVIPMYMGGSFGRKTGGDVAAEAAILAQAVGQPVHVGWTREDDMKYGFRRPQTHHMLQGAVNENGDLVAFEHRLASGDVLLTLLEGTGFGSVLETVLGVDPLGAYGSVINYDIPNRTVFYYRKKSDIPTGPWRGLGSFPNTFAMESFFDELAHTANADPLAYRLANLPEGDLGERMRDALNAVAEASDWENLSSDTVGRGIAMTLDRGTVVALVMSVSVENNRIRPLNVWCAVDPGLVVNPDGAAAQVQGQVVMSLSSALYERVTIENGMVANLNFNQYPLLTMRDTPQIDVIPISSSDTPIGGLGEPVVGTVPAAMSNAIFDLTGQRLRDLPFSLA